MNPQIKTQLFGMMLAATTAIGCIAYEKMVKGSGYFFIGLISAIAYVPFFIGALILQPERTNDINFNKWWVAIFLASGCTSPLWYWLTRTKTVLVGATFEVKYIVILALASIAMGEKGVTPYTILGVALALASIYFISK